jgi:hypothetical protein
VEGKSADLPFNGHHLELTLRTRQLSSNTSTLRSTLPQIVAAPPGSNKEQPANPETAQVQERAPHSAQRASLAVPRVSVKSRIAAFEKKSPTASTFGPSPPQEGKVDTASRSFSINPEKQEESRTLANIITRDFDVAHIDLSQTNSPGRPQSIQEEVRSAPRSGFGVSSRLSLESASRSTPNSETAEILPIPLTFIRQNYKPLRAPPNPPFPPTTNSLQTPSDSSETELSLVATSALDSSKLPEQPSTPRLGRASLALTTVTKGARTEVPLSKKSSLPTSLQVPSFGWQFPPKSLLERVKHNELPGPRPRQEHALERRSRVKPHSRLSQVLCAESSGTEYPAPPPTEPSRFEDNKKRHSFSAPEDHSNFRRSSSPSRNRLATLRSREDLGILEEQAASSEISESSLGEELGRSTGRFSQIALVPKPLKSQRNAVGGAEAKGLDAQESTSTGADTDRQNASNFNFPFDRPKGIGTGIHEEVRCKRTLLPSILPRPGYSSPPNTPEFLESEAQDYNFSIPTFKEVSVSDFERPSRRAVLSPASLIRGSGEPASTRTCCKAPFLEHPQQLLPSGPSRTCWPSITEEQPGYLIAPPKDTILPVLSIENLPNHQQIEGRDFGREGTAHYLDLARSTRFPSGFSRESSESPTINPTNTGGQFSGTPLPREPEEITTHITRTLIQRHLSLYESESITGPDIMNRLRPESALAVSHHRREAMRLAKAQETMVIEKCRRSGASIPEYAFDELIGKGSFGRVYKW